MPKAVKALLPPPTASIKLLNVSTNVWATSIRPLKLFVLKRFKKISSTDACKALLRPSRELRYTSYILS